MSITIKNLKGLSDEDIGRLLKQKLPKGDIQIFTSNKV
jgi:hypothetical protein